MSWLTGSYKLMPGVQGDIDAYGGLAGRVRGWGEGVGMSQAGKSSKKLLKGFASGDLDSNPVFSAFLNPIRNQTAVASSENERRARMGVNGIAPGQQLGLLNAQTNVANQQAQRSGAMAMADLLPQLYGQAASANSQAYGQKLGAQQSAFGMEGDLLGRINQARQAGTYKTGGFLGALGQIGQIAAPFAGALVPGLGALGGLLGKGAGQVGKAGSLSRAGGSGGWPTGGGSGYAVG